MNNEEWIQAQIKQEAEDVCNSIMPESQEPDHTTPSFSGASPARKMEDLGSILKRIVKERSSEHVSTHPRLPQEIVQKKTLWYLDKRSSELVEG